MKPLFFLALFISSYALKGNAIEEPLDAYQDKYVNSFCSKETRTTIICEDDRDTLMGNRADSRAEFEDEKLIRLDYSLTGGEKVARTIAAELVKQYGNPASETDLQDSLSWVWNDDRTELSLSYTSAAENSLGHPYIRVYIAAVRQN